MTVTPTGRPASATGPRETAPGRARAVLRPGAGVARAGYLVAAAVLILLAVLRGSGYDPVSALRASLDYAAGDPVRLAGTVAWGLPLLVATLGVAVAFRAGMFNIGAEGQLYTGAIVAAVVGAYLGPMVGPAHLTLCFVAAMTAGAAVAGALGWLRARFGVDEVLSTLLSNYVIVLFTTYLANGPLRDPGRQSGTTRTVHPSATFDPLVPRTQLTTAVFGVLAMTAVVYWLVERSATGYRWRMTGLNPSFAAAAGFPVRRIRVTSMAASGALAAAAGALLVTTTQGRFWTQIGGGIGWDAVLLALVAASRPLGVVVWVLLYSLLRNGALGMEQAVGIPSELSKVVIALLIIAVAARSGVLDLAGRQFGRRAAALAHRLSRPPDPAVPAEGGRP